MVGKAAESLGTFATLEIATKVNRSLSNGWPSGSK